MSAPPSPAPTRRTIATRVLASFAVTLLAFALTVGWSVQAQRSAASDAEELAAGFVPVALKLGQLRATQATLSTLVDGFSDERDPISSRLVLGTLASVRRAKFLETRTALGTLRQIGSPDSRKAAAELLADLDAAEQALDADKPDLDRLFADMASGDKDGVNRVLVQLGAVEHDGDTRLHALSDRVQASMDRLSSDSRERMLRAVWALGLLSALTLGVGVAVSLHVRRLLAPLATLRERALAVASGDLEPREVRTSDDEIGDLARAFEQMVAGVARAREQALANERLAAIGKMAAHVTHEIRNPLSSIGLNLEMLEEELGERRSPEEARQLLAAVAREVQRLELLSEEYLRVARLPSPRMEAEDIAAAVREVVEFARPEIERGGCTVTVGVEEQLPPAFFDEAQLRQALLNLLRNAREAMPSGGPIDVRVEADGLSVVVSVLDRGSGIPEEIRARVFDPFFSTKGEGTGLGLAITRHIVEAHGGSIQCAPREGGGTAFRVALPIAAPRKAAVPPRRNA
jgi:signal transduction histidine kinase